MAKRFIDSNIFSDSWFCDLSKDGKLFFVYYITQCDHAGVLRLNKKLCEFQTGIKELRTVIEELGNCLVTVKEHLYFMPKYIKYQYPNFPKSAVKQQDSAIKILKFHNLWDNELNSYLTVTQVLPKTYDSGNDNVYSNIEDSNNNINKNDEEKKELHPLQKAIKEKLPTVSKLKTQLTEKDCERLVDEFDKNVIWEILEAMENKADLLKKYSSVNLTIRSWIAIRREKELEKTTTMEFNTSPNIKQG